MRILQVATLFTPDGEYGGPVRVAMNQALALAAAGHEVTLAGAARGFGGERMHVDGVRMRLRPAAQVIPGIGFAGLYAKGLVRGLVRDIGDYDIVHIHLSREFVTLPVATLVSRRGIPYVVQTHGMIDLSNHPLSVPLDRFLTRPALRGADRVLYLTGTELGLLQEFAGNDLHTACLRNGVPMPAEYVEPPDGPPEVLFLARLHQRKRPDLFVRVAQDILRAGTSATFTVVGPDGGMLAALEAQVGEDGGVALEGPVSPDAVAGRMARASVYVLPAVNEPYGMSVLEAMAVGRPVVVTRTCGLADAVRTYECGIVVEESAAALKHAISFYLDNPDAAHAHGRNGRRAVREHFSMNAIRAELEQIYHGCGTGRRSRGARC